MTTDQPNFAKFKIDEYVSFKKRFEENSPYLDPSLDAFLQSAVPNKSVLDIGCGTGERCKTIVRYGAKRVNGFDIQEHLVETAKKATADIRDAVNICVGDQYSMPYGDNTFDAAISIYTLCYAATVEECAKFFEELHRVLAPGGRAAIVTVCDTCSKGLWLVEGADEHIAEEKIKRMLTHLSATPTEEQVNDAFNSADCGEVLKAAITTDKNGRLSLVKSLHNSQHMWFRCFSFTFPGYYYSEEFLIATAKAAGLVFDRIETMFTEERRIAYNSKNPPFKHGESFSKYPHAAMFLVSKPI